MRWRSVIAPVAAFVATNLKLLRSGVRSSVRRSFHLAVDHSVQSVQASIQNSVPNMGIYILLFRDFPGCSKNHTSRLRVPSNRARQ